MELFFACFKNFEPVHRVPGKTIFETGLQTGLRNRSTALIITGVEAEEPSPHAFSPEIVCKFVTITYSATEGVWYLCSLLVKRFLGCYFLYVQNQNVLRKGNFIKFKFHNIHIIPVMCTSYGDLFIRHVKFSYF